MNKPYYKINASEAKLHISLKGNTKLGSGIASFSTLPGNAEHLMENNKLGLLTDIPGTCSHTCQGCWNDCYARKGGIRYHNSCIPSWGENTILLRDGRLWEELDTYLTLKNAKAIKALREGKTLKEAAELAVVKSFRINVSGEVETAQQFDHWVELAIQFPMISFGLYTKNFEALGEYLDYLEANGLDLPDNFAINISQWNHCADEFIKKYADAWKLNVFEYDPTNHPGHGFSDEDVVRLRKMPHCYGITKEGHHRKLPDGSDATCDKCPMSCYKRSGQRIAVYAH